jgi:hypothetical protein
MIDHGSSLFYNFKVNTMPNDKPNYPRNEITD